MLNTARMALLNTAYIALLLSLLGDVAFANAATPATRAEQTLLPSSAGAWLLVLDSWGGFTGHGKGGVTIASDGKVFAHRLGHLLCNRGRQDREDNRRFDRERIGATGLREARGVFAGEEAVVRRHHDPSA